MQHFKIEKPRELRFEDIGNEKIFKVLKSKELQNIAMNPIYYYWDKVKYKRIPDPNISNLEYWNIIRFIREGNSVNTIIKDEKDNFFKWMKLPQYEEFFHKVDMNTGGNLFSDQRDITEKNKYKFISRGIMEEAIASSQLEGASTTRKVAKQMLREKRKPKSPSEQMILNNYLSMIALEEEYKNKELSIDILLELHKMITDKSKEIPEEKQGVFRNNKDDVRVVNDSHSVIYHTPPKIEFVMKEIHNLIDFANDIKKTEFIHPIIKAIMIHFWIGYLHPFCDGNGRLARLLFYWYLLRHGYWAFSYLPISKIIKKAPMQYTRAYAYSEQDNNDLTYFIDYNIRKIYLAIREFDKYLESKGTTNKIMSITAQAKYKLNERQIALLQYLYGDKERKTTVTIHINIYQVSKATAINDLKQLLENGFINNIKVGKNVYYYGTEKITELFR